MEKWPGCGKTDGQKAIEAMGGFRIFFMRRAWTMTRLPKKLQPKPWLRLDHLTFFVDLTYRGTPILSEALPGSRINHQALCCYVRIDPSVKTDAVLPRQALTPLFYQGQLYYEKPFQASYVTDFWLNWSVARSTDNRMACLLDTTPTTDAEYGWDQEQDDDVIEDGDLEEENSDEKDDVNAMPLVFEWELDRSGGGNSEEGVLKKRSPLLSMGCLDCRAIWGDSLSHFMHFKLVELQLRFCHRTAYQYTTSSSSSSSSSGSASFQAPALDNLLLALQQLEWK